MISLQLNRYGDQGWLEDLARLKQGRESHGCGAYWGIQEDWVGNISIVCDLACRFINKK